MKTSDLRLRILEMFRTEEFHGYEVHRKLAVQGMKVEIGNLYRTPEQNARRRPTGSSLGK
ncbi:MAG: hypothetical protein ABSB10_02925 [Candidatus Bathyarchaeia archaeon]|jgi:DNA-binding PadR family transcriptional regulator